MTHTVKHFLAAASGAIAVAVFAGTAGAEPVKWDMADEYGENALTGQSAKYCLGEINRMAEGTLEITYQGGGALGYKSVDHFDAVQDGGVQSAYTLLTQLGGIDPLFNLSSLPFIANTSEQVYQLWQIARPEYAKVFEANNMVLLWAMPNPPSGIHAKAPITDPETLSGLRIRTYDVNGTKTLKAAGAAPLQIAWADLVPQLSTGGVDAVLTSADGGKQLSIWDYVSDFTELNYAMALFVAHVNKDEFDALPAEGQQALMDAIPICDEFNWELMQNAIQVSYDAMMENGMNVTLDDDVPQSVFDLLGDAGEQVRASWIEEVGERGASILEEFESVRN